jgi:hypothetical protein
MDKTEEIFNEIYELTQEALKDLDFVRSYSVLIYGSSINGLATSNNSDLDLSLVVHGIKDQKRAKFGGESFIDII